MNSLKDVITLKEASEIWNMDTSTLRHAIINSKFKPDEVKKSGGTWLLLMSAMHSKYGAPRKDSLNLYTIGYEGLTIEAFVEKLHKDHIKWLVDVREIPLSRKKGFSKKVLSEHLANEGIEYVHFKLLGSPKDVRNELKETKDYKKFFSAYKKYLLTQIETLQILDTAITDNSEMNFCLMCFEKDYTTCHRSVLAEEIMKTSEKNISIKNL